MNYYLPLLSGKMGMFYGTYVVSLASAMPGSHTSNVVLVKFHT